jgi:hypothetical protein
VSTDPNTIATPKQRSAFSDAIDILDELYREDINFASILRDQAHTNEQWNNAFTEFQMLAMTRGNVDMVMTSQGENNGKPQ